VDQHQHGGPRALPGSEPRLLTHLRPCLLAPPPYEELPGVLAVLYTHARMYVQYTYSTYPCCGTQLFVADPDPN
jgi:hypothetical protein